MERYIPDAYSIGKALGPAKSRAFVRIHASGYFHREENAQLEDMTANQFFEYCRIAYLAAERKDDHLDRTLTGREMYHRYADGRCGALLEIDPDSPDEFLAWLDLPESESLHRGWQEFPRDFHVSDVLHFSDFGRARRFALPFVSWRPLPVLLLR